MEVSTTPKAVIGLEPDESVTVPAGFTDGIMNLPGGGQVKGWVPQGTEDPQYMIFYGMNWNGEKDFYRYDLKENTIQRYFQDLPGVDGISSDQYQDVVVTYSDLLHDYDMRGIIIIFLGAVSAALAVALIVVVRRKGRPHPDGNGERPERKSRRRAADDRLEAAGRQAASREPNIRETAEPEDDSFEDSLEDGSFEEEPEDFPEDEEKYDDFEFVDLDLDEDDESSDDKKNKEDEEDDDLELIDL